MKKFLKEVEVYSYDELDGKAREKVKTFYFDIKVDCDAEYFKDYVREDLKEDWGVTDLDMYYSLSYSQGDGVCLYGYVSFADILANENLRNVVCNEIDIEAHKGVLTEVLDGFKLEHSGRYYHADMVDIETCDDPYRDEYTKEIETIVNKLFNNFKGWYHDRCREYEKTGYKIFYEYSDDDVKDWVEVNDYAFDCYGDLVGHYYNLKEAV